MTTRTTTPTRLEIEQGPITVVYGLDRLTGVFLSVVDKRLVVELDDADYTEKVQDVASNSTEVGGGGGSYFDLHTGDGFGQKVDDATMKTFMKRFGVPDMKIFELLGATKLEASVFALKGLIKVTDMCIAAGVNPLAGESQEEEEEEDKEDVEEDVEAEVEEEEEEEDVKEEG